jgi:hypothetical protein
MPLSLANFFAIAVEIGVTLTRAAVSGSTAYIVVVSLLAWMRYGAVIVFDSAQFTTPLLFVVEAQVSAEPRESTTVTEAPSTGAPVATVIGNVVVPDVLLPPPLHASSTSADANAVNRNKDFIFPPKIIRYRWIKKPSAPSLRNNQATAQERYWLAVLNCGVLPLPAIRHIVGPALRQPSTFVMVEQLSMP